MPDCAQADRKPIRDSSMPTSGEVVSTVLQTVNGMKARRGGSAHGGANSTI
jgi:hypothetical protein